MNASSHGNARYENSGGVSHENVGAYALGLLTPGECDAFEAHLAGCDQCGEELEQLMAIAEVMPAAEPPILSVDSERPPAQVAESAVRRDMTGVSASTSAASALGTAGPASSAAPTAAPATAVPAAVAKPARTRRLFALAAGFVLLAVGALGGVVGNQWASDEPARPGNEVAQGLGPGERITAADPATGLEATAALTTKGWGTNVVLQLSKLRGPLTCALVAVKQDGTRETAMTWAVPPKGYGTPEQPDPLLLSGGSSIPRDQLARFEVRDSTGRILVALPA